MIKSEELTRLSETLRVYDVDQLGWEQEPNGVEANLTHVLKHLARDIPRKNFADPDVVKSAIAPDLVQYALRLARWVGRKPTDLTDNHESKGRRISVLAGILGDISVPLAAVMEATGVMANNLHDLDHSGLRDKALERMADDMLEAGGLLLIGAEEQARIYEFNLVGAFDARLASLRSRFDIPEPAAE